MRVEGQGIVADYSPVKNEAKMNQVIEQNHSSGKKTKLGLEDVCVKSSVDEGDLETAAKIMNEAMHITNHYLQFKIHKDSGRVQVKVIDSESDKVIREIPPEKILECSARIKEIIDRMAGILVDELV